MSALIAVQRPLPAHAIAVRALVHYVGTWFENHATGAKSENCITLTTVASTRLAEMYKQKRTVSKLGARAGGAAPV